MPIIEKIVFTGVLYVLAIASGIWLHAGGRPLSMPISAAHKLLALAAVVFTAILLFSQPRFGALSTLGEAAGFAAIAFIVVLFATGAVLSGKKANRALLIVHSVATGLVVTAMVVCAVR